MKHSAIIAMVALAATISVAADDATIAKFSSVTNFLTCSQQIRNDMRAAVKKTAADGDMATFGALVDMLSKNGGARVEAPTFDIWNDAAWALADAALKQRNKKPDEQKELMAGFREGGTTFGLWQGPEVLEKKLDAAMLQVACDLLTRKMPQQDLSLELQYRRASAVLGLQKKAGTMAAQVAAVDAIRQFVVSAKPLTVADTNAVVQAINTTFGFFYEAGNGAAISEAAREYQTKCRDFLASRGELMAMEAREIGGYHRSGNEAAYKAALEKFGKHPVDKNLFKALDAFRSAMLDRRYPAPYAEVLRVAKPLLDKRNQLFKYGELMDVNYFYFSLARSLGDMDAMTEAYKGMCEAFDSAKAACEAENAREKAAREAERLARENKQPAPPPFVRDWSKRVPYDRPSSERRWYVQELQNRGMYAEAIPYLENGLNPRDPIGYISLVVSYIKTGRNADAVKLCQELQGTNTTANADQKFTAASYSAIAQAKTPSDLVNRVKSLRKQCDAMGKDGETQIDKDKRFFSKVRGISRMMFVLDSTESAVPYLKALQSLSWDLLWPEEKVQYTVKFLADAPATAEGALQAGLFSKLPVENRLAKYNVYNWFDKGAEMNRVKSADKPHLNADVAGKEAAIVAAYDQNGLHVYGKFNDPNAWKARDAISGGIGFEYSIMPGEDAPWHWNMFNTTEKTKDWGVVWDSPRKGFKVGMEFFKEDWTIAGDCHVIHLFFPWDAFPYQLPKNGDTWRFALIGGWAGQFGALGGGAVHEMGRSMQLKFEVPGNVQQTLKLGLLRQAVRDYNAVRGKFENADFWVDPHLGDAEFHAQVAAPFMKELDEVSKRVRETELKPGDVDQLLAKYLFALSDFRLALDAKRADWLETKFFAE